MTWSTAFALPKTPEYVSMFSWMSTFGGFAIAAIYLFIAVGALRGLRRKEKAWQLYLACLVGGVVTAAAIYGAIYKVTAPTVWAPYSAVVLLDHRSGGGGRDALDAQGHRRLQRLERGRAGPRQTVIETNRLARVRTAAPTKRGEDRAGSSQ